MLDTGIDILENRTPSIITAGEDGAGIRCEAASLAGSVSQRACVFCGSRVVLYPIADALHLVHGPIGCAAYTWDIRGALSSGPELNRMSFSTDLGEKEVIYGGADKLRRALDQLIDAYQPQAAFVYATCVSGLIGDDIGGVCREMERKKGLTVIPVLSEGFMGTKKDGYRSACDALARLVGTDDVTSASPVSINILGDFNIAGETWIIKDYYRRMGIDVIACVTGDGRVGEIRRAHRAALNVVQCSGSMTHLARRMEEDYDIPFIRVSYFGLEDTANALYEAAGFFRDPGIFEATASLVRAESEAVLGELDRLRRDLAGKRAAVYVGGSFKAFSLVKALRHLGMETVVVGSQTGNKADYDYLVSLCAPGTIIVDDTNPLELTRFLLEKDADLLVGGVKERPLAYKLGIAFCDHNHERKIPLAGFVGMLNFAREVHASVTSPVWKFASRRGGRGRTV